MTVLPDYYLRTGVKGCFKIRRALAKSCLILDEMCRLYGKFASYVRRVLFFHTKKEFNVQTPPRSLGPTKRECY